MPALSGRPAPAADPVTRRDIRFVLWVSGLLGGLLGGLGFADWQVAVETAQVLAGIVRYPADNPFFMYHIKLWSMLHQLLALGLHAGITEWTASLLVSALLGMVTLQAFAVLILAFGRDRWLALGGAVAVVFTRPTEFGVIYPVWFMGSSHTYGVLGLSYCVWVIALLAVGARRLGGVLLGTAVAVHASLGVWLTVVVGGCALWDLRRFRHVWLPWAPWVVLGWGITVASWLVHRSWMPDASSAIPAEAMAAISAFVALWDGHRVPVDPHHPGVYFNVAVVLAAAAALRILRGTVPHTARLALQAAVVTSLVGLLAMGFSWLPPDELPRTLVMLMPARVLNLSIVLSLPLLLGCLGAYRDTVWGSAALALLLGGLVLGGDTGDGLTAYVSSHLWSCLTLSGVDAGGLGWAMVHPWRWMAAITLGGLGAAAIGVRAREPGASAAGPNRSAGHPALVRRLRQVSLAICAACAVLLSLLAAALYHARTAALVDRTNNAVLAEAAKGSGTLLTGGDLHLVQLRTRRPVLIDGGGLDGMVYTPASAVRLATILHDVYRIDLFDPPPEAYRTASVPPVANREAWQRLSTEDWQAIRRAYDVRDVLTAPGWSLALPLVAGDSHHLLYRIPD